jgi:hypothetical protein
MLAMLGSEIRARQIGHVGYHRSKAPLDGIAPRRQNGREYGGHQRALPIALVRQSSRDRLD